MPNELDELYAMVTSQEDKVALQAIIDRNAPAKARIESATAVYNAFVAGDESAIDKAAREAAARAAAAQPAPAATTGKAQIDLAELEKMVDARTAARTKAFIESPEFVTSQETLAEKVAERVTKKFEADILGKAAMTSDSIYQIRASHAKEFGEELNTEEFTKFINENPGKFGSLAKTHDAWVQDKRIALQIDKGVAAKLAEKAAATVEVPGTSLPSAESPLGAMIRANKLTVGETARGPAIDNAVKAFRKLQVQHAGVN